MIESSTPAMKGEKTKYRLAAAMKEVDELVQMRYIYSMPVERIIKYFADNGFTLSHFDIPNPPVPIIHGVTYGVKHF